MHGYNVTCLHVSSAFGHFACCRVLLDCGADVEAKDQDGRTPLMYAKTCEVVQLLLSRGANINTRDRQRGWTALHHCACAGLDKWCVGELVSAGAIVSAEDNDRKTPLMVLIRYAIGDVRELDFGLELVKRGADANTTEHQGKTLLHLCVEKLRGDTDVLLVNHHSQIIRELVQLGADLDARTAEGNTALSIATENGQKEMVCQLIQLGANVKALERYRKNEVLLFSIEKNHFAASARLISQGADLNTSNENSETALHCAAKVGCLNLVQELVKAGAGMEACDAHGNTPLLLAAENGYTQIVCALADAGAAVDVCNRHGEAGVWLAAKNGHTRTVCALADAGARVDVCNRHEETAIHLAAKNGHTNTVAHLVAYGALVNPFDSMGCTPLFRAIHGGFTDTAHELRKAGATLEATDKDGNTSLHLAVKTYQHELVKSLVEAGANVQALNRDGESPLLLTAKLDSTLAATYQLQAGASTDECENGGNAPLSVTAKRGNGELCCELVRYGAMVDDTISFSACLSNAIKAGDARLLARLVAAGASINECDENGSSALHVALTFKQSQVAGWIIEHGGKVSVANKLGQTPLHIAATKDCTSIATKLLEVGASVDVRENDGSTPLSVASKRGNGELSCELVRCGAKVDDTISFFPCVCNAIKAEDVDLLGRLVTIGASVNDRDGNGCSALHVALLFQRVEIAELIIRLGGDVSMANAGGFTPLHLAAQLYNSYARLHVVKLLLAKGADPTAVTNRSQTARDIAKQRKDYNVATVLEKAELAHELAKEGGLVGSPDSVAVRLGGPPGAGKSTLADALQVTWVQGFFRYESQTDEGATNVCQRTKGINCQMFVDEKSSRFTIFDLGGHGEFLATHQMFIGDGSVPVIDCVVVSALDEKLKDNALKWCSLFASRNQPIAKPWPLLLVAT